MTDTAPEPLVPEGWELRANRSAMLHLPDRRITLKAPTLGELRRISEAIENASDSITASAHDLDKRQRALREARERGELDAAESRRQDRKLGREFNRFTEDTWWGVLVEVATILGTAALTDDDELPAWVRMSAADQLATLVGHWKSAPPPRGVRS